MAGVDTFEKGYVSWTKECRRYFRNDDGPSHQLELDNNVGRGKDGGALKNTAILCHCSNM